ncbi:MAG: hypothetical protein ACXAE3_03245 [Candidatus Kariarchaeaceae archaeon]|jgi:hypothetical protein
MTGEIIENIEKSPSSLRIWGVHGSGLLGMVFGVLWIGFLLAVSYVEPIVPDIFIDSWYTIGLWLIITTSVASFMTGLFKFVIGKTQGTQALEIIKDMVNVICFYLLYVIFPFDFGDFNTEVGYFMLFLVIVSGFSSLNNMVKTINWDPKDTVSIHKTV